VPHEHDERKHSADPTRPLLALTRALSGARTRREVARVAIRHGRAALGAARGYLYVRSADGTSAELVASAGYPRSMRNLVRTLPLDQERPAARAVRLGEEGWVADLASPAAGAVDPTAMLTGTHGTAAMPLVHEGRIVGAVGFSFLEGHAWAPDERDLVRAIGGVVAQALARVMSAETREAERRQALINQGYLAEASAVLASSLEWEDTLRTVARLAVPRIADWCSVDLLEDGELRQLIVEHRDPEKAERVRDLRRRYPVDLDGELGAAAVIRSGQPQLIRELPPEAVHAAARGEELRAVAEELGLRSLMCVPLHGREGVVGAITFVSTDSGRLFGADDVGFAEALAVRAASAIENARLFRDADRFRRMIDAHTDAVLLFDPESLRVHYANHGAAAAAGRGAAELAAGSVADLFADADADRLRELVRPITEGRTEARTLVLRLAGAHGEVPMEVLVQGVRLPGEPLAALAIARDISERLDTQARLRRLAEAEHARAAELNAVIRAMGDGVLVCAADGAVTLANPAIRELVGGPPLATYDDLRAALDDPDAAPELGSRGGPVELRLRGSDERWLQIATYPVGLLPGQDRRETIVVARDVTDARLSQALRETFVGVLSHELRTPITTIFGGAKLLARNSRMSDDERQAIFTDIHIEAERLHRLVEDVIALQRFGEEGIDIGHEPVLLQRILPGIISAEQGRWPGARFSVDVASGLPTVTAEPTYVEQVVRNLLSNAAKYGGDGVAVRTIVEGSGDEVIVRIVDDGPGFPADEGDRLFELYFRSPRTATRVSGAGIGLFVCARLIRAMGGRIWARRPDDGGAEFGFSLQRMDEDPAA